jgi:hypothetical protein
VLSHGHFPVAIRCTTIRRGPPRRFLVFIYTQPFPLPHLCFRQLRPKLVPMTGREIRDGESKAETRTWLPLLMPARCCHDGGDQVLPSSWLICGELPRSSHKQAPASNRQSSHRVFVSSLRGRFPCRSRLRSRLPRRPMRVYPLRPYKRKTRDPRSVGSRATKAVKSGGWAIPSALWRLKGGLVKASREAAVLASCLCRHGFYFCRGRRCPCRREQRALPSSPHPIHQSSSAKSSPCLRTEPPTVTKERWGQGA